MSFNRVGLCFHKLPHSHCFSETASLKKDKNAILSFIERPLSMMNRSTIPNLSPAPVIIGMVSHGRTR